MKKLKVVHVIWLDSEAENAWTPIDEIQDKLEDTHSVGFLISEEDSFIVLALSYDLATDSINSYKKIPTAAIRKIKTLKTLQL